MFQFSALFGKARFVKSHFYRAPDQQTAYFGWDEQLWNLGNSAFTRGRTLYPFASSLAIVLWFVRKRFWKSLREPVPGEGVSGWRTVSC